MSVYTIIVRLQNTKFCGIQPKGFLFLKAPEAACHVRNVMCPELVERIMYIGTILSPIYTVFSKCVDR